MKLETSGIGRVERHARPLLSEMVVIPVLTNDGRDTGIAIYVVKSTFLPKDRIDSVESVAAKLALFEELRGALLEVEEGSPINWARIRTVLDATA